MALLIDGHNLIGAEVFDDIRLSDEDDEAKLVARLKVWRSRYRGKITVIFDRGMPGGRDRELSGGGVEVIFAADPAEADDLIRRRLRRRPKNLELVTNDATLLAEAATYGVAALRGAELVERFSFAAPDGEEPGAEADVSLSAEEVEAWLDVFGVKRARPRKSGNKQPTRSRRSR